MLFNAAAHHSFHGAKSAVSGYGRGPNPSRHGWTPPAKPAKIEAASGFHRGGSEVAMRSIGLTALVLAAVGEAPAQHVQHSANILINAGFVARAADTPEKLMRLKRFPIDKFAQRKTGDGRVYYVYADPILCVCAYVGTQQAMDTYRREMAPILDTDAINRAPPSGISPMNEMIYDMGDDDVENAFNDDAFHPRFF
jgi:hypothetical protein